MKTEAFLKTEPTGGSTFGIRIETDQGETRAYPDISERRSDAERLMRRLEQGDVSPVHCDDVVRDFILELAYERLSRNGLE